eukprot:EG_transcript_25792
MLTVSIRGLVVELWDPAQSQIWPHVASGLFLFLLLAASFLCPLLRRHIVPVHAVTAILLTLHNAVTAYFFAAHYPSTETGKAMAALEGLLAGQPGDPFLRIVANYVNTRCGFDAGVGYVVMGSCPLWFTLILAGLNPWTVAAYVSACVSMCVSGVFLPYIDFDGRILVVFGAGLLSMAAFSITVVLERLHRSTFLAERLLTQELQASQMADSVLNHTLKNTLADVAANMEIFLAGRAPPSVLEDSIVCLRR